MGYQTVKMASSCMHHFDTIPACDRRTDRNVATNALFIRAACCKNYICCRFMHRSPEDSNEVPGGFLSDCNPVSTWIVSVCFMFRLLSPLAQCWGTMIWGCLLVNLCMCTCDHDSSLTVWGEFRQICTVDTIGNKDDLIQF